MPAAGAVFRSGLPERSSGAIVWRELSKRPMFTVDASVHLNALNPSEAGSEVSRALLERLHRKPWPVHAPTLLLVEVSGAVARAEDDAERGVVLSRAIEELPGQIWIPLDESLAAEAARLAAERRLRGADAVYASVARRHGSILVTRDEEQLGRLPPVVRAVTPEEALVLIDALEEDLVGGRSGEGAPPLASPRARPHHPPSASPKGPGSVRARKPRPQRHRRS